MFKFKELRTEYPSAHLAKAQIDKVMAEFCKPRLSVSYWLFNAGTIMSGIKRGDGVLVVYTRPTLMGKVGVFLSVLFFTALMTTGVWVGVSDGDFSGLFLASLFVAFPLLASLQVRGMTSSEHWRVRKDIERIMARAE